MFWKLIGVAAALLTMFAFVPQIARALKTKSVKDVSPVMLMQLALGVTLWVAYGVYLKDAIIIAANLVTLLTMLILLKLYLTYQKKG
jgi:MtN3 and saliva related transmembrane protein